MALRLEHQHKSALTYGYSFDAYWLGGTRNTGWWKNITRPLLETASADIATPIRVDPSELRGGTQGLVDYKATINHPHPSAGGGWRERGIQDYLRIAPHAPARDGSQGRAHDHAGGARDDARYRGQAGDEESPREACGRQEAAHRGLQPVGRRARRRVDALVTRRVRLREQVGASAGREGRP